MSTLSVRMVYYSHERRGGDGEGRGEQNKNEWEGSVGWRDEESVNKARGIMREELKSVKTHRDTATSQTRCDDRDSPPALTSLHVLELHCHASHEGSSRPCSLYPS